jgi:hypothetical protein
MTFEVVQIVEEIPFLSVLHVKFAFHLFLSKCFVKTLPTKKLNEHDIIVSVYYSNIKTMVCTVTDWLNHG